MKRRDAEPLRKIKGRLKASSFYPCSSSLRLSVSALHFPSSLLAFIFVIVCASASFAHPLGNFTVNRYARIEVGSDRLRIHYVIDMAEIPTFQELQTMSASGSPSAAELDAYLQARVSQYANGLLLTVDGARLPLKPIAQKISTPAGMGGLSTLRIECDYEALLESGNTVRRLRFEDGNNQDRTGWREIVVTPVSGVAVFNSSAYGNGLTDEIKAYPQDMLTAPLNERAAELSFTRGSGPTGANALRTRDGRALVQTRDRFAELINVPEVTPLVALLGLLLAAALGAAHAFSPGHGKTVVGAYLIGSRGTPRHAAFLGLTVTATHTSSVFALGLITLFASHYINPEKLFPILTLASGAIVLSLGLSLFFRRLSMALAHPTHDHPHEHSHHPHTQAHQHSHDHSHQSHEHLHTHEHSHSHEHDHDSSLLHSHGGRAHTHLPPGADGNSITWRSLLALGVSGGLLPCPSALVVLLSAIAWQRVGYGLILIVAFSLGLASTLTGIGLAFVYVGKLMKLPARFSGLVRVLPVLSAFVIACVGAAICYEALTQSGFGLFIAEQNGLSRTLLR